MTGKETLSIGLITSAGNETEQYVNLLQQHQVAVGVRLHPSEIAAEHIANNSLHVWLLDIDENDWTDQLDDLLDQSQVPVFFHERGSLSSQSHPEFWIEKQLERLYDMAGLPLPEDEPPTNIDSPELTDVGVSNEAEDSVSRLEQVTEELSSTLKNLASDSAESSSMINDVVEEVEQVAHELEPDSENWNESDLDFDLNSSVEALDSEEQDFLEGSEDEFVAEHSENLQDESDALVEPSEIEFELSDNSLDQSISDSVDDELMADHLDNDLDDFAADLDEFLDQKDAQENLTTLDSTVTENEEVEPEILQAQTNEPPPSPQRNDAYDKPMGFDEAPDDWLLDSNSDDNHAGPELSFEEETVAPDESTDDWTLELTENDDEPSISETIDESSVAGDEPSSIDFTLEPLQDSAEESKTTFEQNELSLEATDTETIQDNSAEDLDSDNWELDLDSDEVNLELDLSMSEADSSNREKVEPIINDNFPEESVIEELENSDDGLDFSFDEDFDTSLEQVPANNDNDDQAASIDKLTSELSLQPLDDDAAEVAESVDEDTHLLELPETETEAGLVANEEQAIEDSDGDELESLDIPLLDDAAVGMQFDAVEEPEEEIDLPDLNLWVLGASLGGPAAVKRFLQALPRDLDTAFVLAQHIDDNFLPVLCEILDTQTPFRSIIIDQPMPMKAGCVYIAPIKHKISFTSNGMVDVVHESWTPPYSPCIDDVIYSAGEVYRNQCGVIIFSGMGSDGSLGLERVRSFAVRAWAQSPDSCANSSMPESAIDKQLIEFIGHPEQLARQLKEQLESAVSV